MKTLYVAFVTAGMFVVRLITFLLMLIMQKAVGGAEVARPQSLPPPDPASVLPPQSAGGTP